MEEPLGLTTRIVPLLSLSVKLVNGALDKTATTSHEAAEQLKALQRDLGGLEKQILLLKMNLGVVSTNRRDRHTSKLLRGRDGQQAIKELCSALDETLRALELLPATTPGAVESVQGTFASSSLGDDTIKLKRLGLDITTCLENLKKTRLRFTEAFSIDNNCPIDNVRGPSAIFTLHRKLVVWLKRRRPGRPGDTHETEGDGRTPVLVTPSAFGNILVPTSSSNPSTTTGLLQLPTELKLCILDMLNHLCRDERPSESNPFLALRLTCKLLASICAPLAFRTIRLDRVGPDRANRLTSLSHTLGEFVCNLTLAIPNGPLDVKKPQMDEVLHDMPNLRTLTLIHEREDVQPHTLIHDTIYKLEYLDHITLEEARYDPQFININAPHIGVAVSQTFFHRFLKTVLKAHSHHLRTLQLKTLLPLDPDLFRTIRDSTPHLQSVSFAASLDLDLRDLFANPTAWASGKTGSLEALTIYKCNGADAGDFVRNVLRGVYGTQLKDVKFISSGTDIPDIPPASTPVLASIERLLFDHSVPWEISALSFIPIQDLSLTRMRFDAFIELSIRLTKGLSDSCNVGFKGLKWLRLNPNLASPEAWEGFPVEVKGAYVRLREVCCQRDIRLTFDAEVLCDACAIPHV